MSQHEVSDEFYEQGRTMYRTGGTLRQLFDAGDAAEKIAMAEHEAIKPSFRVDHDAIDKRYRNAPQSLVIGFLDGLVADMRGARRGEQA